MLILVETQAHLTSFRSPSTARGRVGDLRKADIEQSSNQGSVPLIYKSETWTLSFACSNTSCALFCLRRKGKDLISSRKSTIDPGLNLRHSCDGELTLGKIVLEMSGYIALLFLLAWTPFT